MRKKSKSTADTNPCNTLKIAGIPADRPRAIAQIAVAPDLQAALTTKQWSHATPEELDITGLVDELRQQGATASRGDLNRQEAMLAIQAHTLDTIFNELARRSQANIGQYLDAADRYMRLALKAQSQCRATIETLAEIKNPKPVAFVQQANITNGPQQVNNGPPLPADASRAGKSEVQQDKLLEADNAERMDIRTAGEAIGSDPAMATVGAIYGASDGRR